jgi:hypothetical protein
MEKWVTLITNVAYVPSALANTCQARQLQATELTSLMGSEAG